MGRRYIAYPLGPWTSADGIQRKERDIMRVHMGILRIQEPL